MQQEEKMMKKTGKIIGSLLFAVAVMMTITFAQAKEYMDLSRNMSITVSVDETTKKHLSDASEADNTLCYDLYKIADIEEKDFTFTTTSNYQQLAETLKKLEQDRETDFTGLATDSMRITFGDEKSLINETDLADYSGLSLDKKIQIKQGLYLLVARGTLENTTTVEKVQMADAGESSAYGDVQLASRVRIGTEIYTILPQIICVPAKTSADGKISSPFLENGIMIYDQQIVLKSEVEPATGSIEIIKNLDSYYQTENATFVFQVDAYYPTKDTLYSSNVYAVTFTQAGEKSVLAQGLPVGAIVEVSEIYSGVNYDLTVDSPEKVELLVKDNETEKAEFYNRYNNKRTGGGGVINHFTYQIDGGEGNWSWQQIQEIKNE